MSRALRVLAAAALAGCAARSPEPSTPGEARFTILHFNDIYKVEGLEGGARGGPARVRTLRRQLEAEAPVLVVVAGDVLFPSVLSKYFSGRPMLDMLNQLDGAPAGFDERLVLTLGNHEFDSPDPGILLGRLGESDFRWVSTNVRYCRAPGSCGEKLSERAPAVHEELLLELGGVKVGLVGLSHDLLDVSYADIDPQSRERLRAALSRLREGGARVIVALSHQDLEDDLALAAEESDIDLVTGGHEHVYTLERQGRTWVGKADADAASVLVWDVRVPARGRPEIAPRRVLLDSSMPEDPALAARARGWVESLDAILPDSGRVVGWTAQVLEGAEPKIRGRETALGNFLADVAAQRMEADFGLIHGGCVRINDDIPPGPIRAYDLEGIFYFDNLLVSFELTGAELLELLRTSVAKLHLGDGRFLQVSGIRFRYHPGGTPSEPTYRIDAEDVQVRRRGAAGFEPLDLGRRYTAASTDYLWTSGWRDGYGCFAQGRGGTSPTRADEGRCVAFRLAVEEAIAGLPDKLITTRIEGRITRAGDPAR